jgi:hypothetical protein
MKRTPLLVVLLVLALSGAAVAGTGAFALGLGTFGVIVDAGDPYGDDTFMGGALVGTYAFDDHKGVRGLFYATEHEDVSTLENNGFEAQFLFGSHLMREGFRYYGLAGYYSETWEVAAVDRDFSGLTVGFGIGYTWKKVILDWWGAWRQPGDYQDMADSLGATVDMTAAAGALALSYRF